MARVKARGVPQRKPRPAMIGSSHVALPLGAYQHPQGLLIEIGAVPERDLAVIRVGGKLDSLFKNGEPFGCNVVDPPVPMYKPPEPSPLSNYDGRRRRRSFLVTGISRI